MSFFAASEAEGPGPARPSLSAALERALVVQLGQTWAEINQNHFRGRLRRPVIALSDTERRLGAWDGQARTLTVARSLVLGRSWMVVREVLKHEMAHQFVDEVLGVHDQTAHGPVFEQLCRQHGFDATAAGMPELAEGEAGLADGSPILRRIARLLALAESPNAHEAEAAMRAAQRLMLKHNIDVAAAATREGFTFRQVGSPSGRVSGAEHVLAGILARHFFVEAIWVPSYLPLVGKQGRVLELCGTTSNLDVAVYVHGFLLETGERLWRGHRRERGLTGNGERRRYLLGVMMGFDDKLNAAANENRREGLIWVGDPALTEYLGRRYPRRTGGSGIGVRPTESYHDGRRAGRNIVLAKPMTAPGAPGSSGGGRYLPPR